MQFSSDFYYWEWEREGDKIKNRSLIAYKCKMSVKQALEGRRRISHSKSEEWVK